MSDTAFAREVQRLVREHALGWWVAVREQEEGPGAGEARGGRARAEVEIGHPLSNGFRIILGGGPPAIPLTVESVRRWLTEGSVAWHVEVLATAPEPRNPETVRWIRTFAEMFVWSNLEVRSIAGLFSGVGALSEEEQEWLARTTGEDAPEAPRPNPEPTVVDEYRYRIGQ